MISSSLGLHDGQAVLDVGGGTGALISHLLAANPTLKGAVLDLAEAKVGASAMFAEAAVSDRAEFVAGDFFTAVPEGYDVHVLTAVLHDWSDDDCVRILRNCAAALAPGGRIVVVDNELDPGVRNSFAQSTDALMLAFTPGGRERTSREFGALWNRAGVHCIKQVTLPSLGKCFQLQVR
jgi:SAM-dependent methyltransferase